MYNTYRDHSITKTIRWIILNTTDLLLEKYKIMLQCWLLYFFKVSTSATEFFFPLFLGISRTYVYYTIIAKYRIDNQSYENIPHTDVKSRLQHARFQRRVRLAPLQHRMFPDKFGRTCLGGGTLYYMIYYFNSLRNLEPWRFGSSLRKILPEVLQRLDASRRIVTPLPVY